MKKIIFTLFIISLNLYATQLKNDEFDIQKLGKTVEEFVLKVDALNTKITLLEKELDDLKEAREGNNLSTFENIKNKNSKILENINAFNKNIQIDIRTVNTKKGIIAYSEPYSINELYLKRYEYGENLSIDYCNKYGWCKLKDKKEYVAEYLLIKNENY